MHPMTILKPAVLSALLLISMTANSFAQSTWTKRTSGTTNDLYGATWYSGQLVTVGGGSVILTSPDGITWTKRVSGTGWLRTVTWAETRFVAGGSDSVRTSPDGVTWTAVRNAPSIRSLAWNGSLLVAAWAGCDFVTSPDGITWAAGNFTGGCPNYITWTGSQLWALGYNIIYQPLPKVSSVAASLPGIQFTTPGSIGVSTSITLNAATTAGSLLAIVGSGGSIITAPAGNNWVLRLSGTTSGLNAVIWTGNQLITVGDSGTILASSDGITWKMKTSGTKKNLRAVIWTGNLIVVMGDSGTILTSPQDVVPITPYLHALKTQTGKDFYTVAGRKVNFLSLNKQKARSMKLFSFVR